jgi:hypothetical protein
MSTAEIDQLIVEHLADIDAAAKQLYDIEHRVFGAMGETASEWASKNGWFGRGDFVEEELWLAPADWRTPDAGTPDDFLAKFYLDFGANDTGEWKVEEDFFYLTRLCQKNTGKIGLRFYQDVTTQGRWRKMLKDCARCIEKTAFAVDNQPSFFLPVRIEAAELAAALKEGSFESVLQPFEAVLRHLGDAKPAFDSVLAAIKAVES